MEYSQGLINAYSKIGPCVNKMKREKGKEKSKKYNK